MTTPAETAYRSKRAILVGYAVGLFAISLKAGDPADLEWWAGAVPFLLYELSPVAFLCLVRKPSVVMAVGALLLSVGGLLIYCNSMFGAGATSTSALIFAVLPAYQWLAALAVWAISFMEPTAAPE